MANYKKETTQNYISKAKELYATFPEFAMDFYRYQDSRDRSGGTILNYAYDLNTFFHFLLEANPTLSTIKDISLSYLDCLNKKDIEDYLLYLKNNKNVASSARCRSLSALRSFYKYYQSNDDIKSNPAALCDMPKKTEKKQPRLTRDEFNQLLNNTKASDGLTDNQKKYTLRSTLRDEAIIALLGSTGIRVSELCGINLSDIDFKNRRIKITRKGNREELIEFEELLEEKLKDYIQYERTPNDDNEEALFIGSRASNTGRLTTKSVQRIVKKYSATITNQKITPHSLRRTYGTNLYQEHGDIKLVADALGHKNVQVTKDHYTDIGAKERKKIADFGNDMLK